MAQEIGALWLKQIKKGDRAGEQYFSGTLKDIRGEIRIAVFMNDKKEKENQPDWKIVLSEDYKKEGDGSAQRSDLIRKPPFNKKAEDEDIPIIEDGDELGDGKKAVKKGFKKVTPTGEPPEAHIIEGDEIDVKDIPL